MAAQLEHPVAIRVLELGLEHDRPYAVLEWVGATTLAESVKTSGPRTPSRGHGADPCRLPMP